MRIIGLNLLVAIALFGVAYVNSDRQQVVDAYRAYVQAYASGEIPPPELAWTWQNRQWR